MRSAASPRSVRYFFAASARRCPSARLYSRLPRSSQFPSIRIEGNCDERGSREYNLALGQRRADAAKKYLTDLGLAADRITTISYGKERPRAPGHDEEAWKENRRDDLVPSSQTRNAVSQDSR